MLCSRSNFSKFWKLYVRDWIGEFSAASEVKTSVIIDMKVDVRLLLKAWFLQNLRNIGHTVTYCWFLNVEFNYTNKTRFEVITAVHLRIIKEMEVNSDIPFAAISVVYIHVFLQLSRGKFDKNLRKSGRRNATEQMCRTSWKGADCVNPWWTNLSWIYTFWYSQFQSQFPMRVSELYWDASTQGNQPCSPVEATSQKYSWE